VVHDPEHDPESTPFPCEVSPSETYGPETQRESVRGAKEDERCFSREVSEFTLFVSEFTLFVSEFTLFVSEFTLFVSEFTLIGFIYPGPTFGGGMRLGWDGFEHVPGYFGAGTVPTPFCVYPAHDT
jgi:hypothetical protein